MATSSFLVAVGPASKWDWSRILRGHVEAMMAAAKAALNTQARMATGVEVRLVAADEWLAARFADWALTMHVLLVQSADEHQDLMQLMSEDEYKWVEVGSWDWGYDSECVKDSAWGEALLLAYSREGSVMLNVMEAPSAGDNSRIDRKFRVKLLEIEGSVVFHPAVGAPAKCRLFEGLCVDRNDNLDEILWGKGKGKLPARWAGEIDEDDHDGDHMDMEDAVLLLDGRSRAGHACGGGCLARIMAFQGGLGRVEDMAKMLIAFGGLASRVERLEVENRKGRMARDGYISVAKAAEQVKVEAVVNGAEKCMKDRELDDARTEQARFCQVEPVNVNEAARAAAEAVRDRLVTEGKKCTDRPNALEAAEEVVEAARMLGELEREVQPEQRQMR